MPEPRVPSPHHVYDEATDLDTISLSIGLSYIAAQVLYVPDVTDIPQGGQIAEFRLLGTSVQGIVTYASLMSGRDEPLLLIQATRIQE